MKLVTLLSLFIVLSSFLKAGVFYSSETGWSWYKVVVKATPEEQLEYCKSLEEKKDWSSARAHYHALIKYFVHSKEVNEAYHRIGEILIIEGKINQAERYYRKLLKKEISLTAEKYKSPYQKKENKVWKWKKKKDEDEIIFQILLRNLDTEKDPNALNLDMRRIMDNLYKIGDLYMDGARFKLFGKIPLWKQSSKGVEIFQNLIKRAPSLDYAPQMRYKIAINYFKKKDYIEAIINFKKLSYEYGLSKEAETTSYYIGLSYLKLNKGPGYNEQDLITSEANFRDYLLSFPIGEKAELAKQHIKTIADTKAESLLIRLKFFIRRKKWKSAGFVIKDLRSKFAKSNAAEAAEKILLSNDKISL